MKREKKSEKKIKKENFQLALEVVSGFRDFDSLLHPLGMRGDKK